MSAKSKRQKMSSRSISVSQGGEMLPWSAELSGRLEEHVIESEQLRTNPLGDPHVRPLWVYLPPGYDDAPTRRYPSIYMLQGYLGHLEMWRNRLPFQQPLIETADDAFARALAPPAIVVFVDARYRTIDSRDHRGIAGKSSGGFGAMITPMLRPDLFGGLATHAGDALFEYTCTAKFPRCLRFLREYQGDIERWWK